MISCRSRTWLGRNFPVIRPSSASIYVEFSIALILSWAYEIAQVQAYLGNLDESFRWLHRAIDRRDQSLNLITGDPLLENLRDDPRFDAVLERLGRKAP